MEEINNLFSDEEIVFIKKESQDALWQLSGNSDEKYKGLFPSFWYKRLFDIDYNFNYVLSNFLKNKLEYYFKRHIEMERIYFNGQAHGQCGFWHQDYPPSEFKRLTLVYFINKWKPEFGGHLLVKKDNQVYSFLPQYNYGVLFDGTLDHMGLEPSIHCKTQRESLACKFILW